VFYWVLFFLVFFEALLDALYTMCRKTSSHAVAQRSRDASYLLVASVVQYIAGPDPHNNLVVRVLYRLDPRKNLATLQNL